MAERSVPVDHTQDARLAKAALEKHYRVQELASLWRFSDNTTIRLFAEEPASFAWNLARDEIGTNVSMATRSSLRPGIL